MAKESMEFKTEMKRMMDIIIHSLYSNKDIFLRELISNACDAIDKVRFESITNAEMLEGNSDWKIKIIPDQEAKTLTISDNGIGMNRDAVIENLGTVAKSGTKEFLEKLQEAEAKDKPELIGQFGLGFYSSFMVADSVTVISRMNGDPKDGIKWTSDGKGEFQLEQTDKETRGTDIILQMKEDDLNYLESYAIQNLVRSFSDFIEHPVVMDIEKTNEDETKTVEEQTLNSRKAIWQKSKSEIKEEEYQEFYKHISRDFENPAQTIHYIAEGTVDFKALLFLPKKRPFDFLYPDKKIGLSLYIKRVFIMDDCKDLLPNYLRFVQGVVDASDIPLNVSRELLQQNPLVDKIKANLVKRIIKTMNDMKKDEEDAYKDFYKEFGIVIKEGVYSDWTNKDQLADLLLYETSEKEADTLISLDQYIEEMPEGQEEIYYLLGENRTVLAQSPHLESFKSKGHSVLFMTDPIDEWVTESLQEYKGKKLKAIDKGEVKTDEEDKEKKTEQEEKFGGLLTALNTLIEEVKEVRLSSRLTESPSCLITEEGKMGAYVENVMKKIQPEGTFEESARILEINADHPIVVGLQKIFEKDVKDRRVEDYGQLLYAQAVLSEGSKLKDPQAFTKRLNTLMLKDIM